MPRPGDRFRTAREMGAAVAEARGLVDPDFEVAAAMDRFALEGNTIVAPHNDDQ